MGRMQPYGISFPSNPNSRHFCRRVKVDTRAASTGLRTLFQGPTSVCTCKSQHKHVRFDLLWGGGESPDLILTERGRVSLLCSPSEPRRNAKQAPTDGSHFIKVFAETPDRTGTVSSGDEQTPSPHDPRFLPPTVEWRW